MKKTVENLNEKERQHMCNKKYYAENQEKELRRVAEYKKQHKDELREKNRQYRELNKERIKAYRDTPRMKAYQKEYQQLYRAKKKAEAELLKNIEKDKDSKNEFIRILLELVSALVKRTLSTKRNYRWHIRKCVRNYVPKVMI